jgi:cellulose synthase/poly-beta-1,6-N-acetylglucosamine synthase-like glycosyltransferase
MGQPEKMSEGNSSTAPSVSVITVIKRGGEAAFLSSLQNQEYGKPFEILVVEGGNRSQARNFGVAQSRAPLISFIDADCEAPPDWMAGLLLGLPDDEMVAGFGGVSRGKTSASTREEAIDAVFSTYLGSLNSPSLISVPDTKRYLVNAISAHNCLYRRTALIEVGGFDNGFLLNEDTDLCARLREKGYRLILDRSISVHHKRRASMADFTRQFFWYGVGRIRSMLTRPNCVDGKIVALFLTAIILAFLTPVFPFLGETALLGYLLAVTVAGVVGAKRVGALRLLPVILALFIVEHFSYLIGLVVGMFMGRWKESETCESMQMERHLVLPTGKRH